MNLDTQINGIDIAVAGEALNAIPPPAAINALVPALSTLLHPAARISRRAWLRLPAHARREILMARFGLGSAMLSNHDNLHLQLKMHAYE